MILTFFRRVSILALSAVMILISGACEDGPAAGVPDPVETAAVEEDAGTMDAPGGTGEPSLTIADSFQYNVTSMEVVKPAVAEVEAKFRIDCRVFNTAVIDGGVLYTDCGDKDAIIATDLSGGSEKWRYTWSEPDEDFVNTPRPVGGIVYASSEQYLYALDPASGAVKWRYLHQPEPERGAGMLIMYALDETGAYILAGSEVHAVDATTGTDRWKAKVCDGESVTMSSPVVAGDYLFFPNSCLTGSTEEDFALESRLFAFNRDTGEELWSRKLNSQEDSYFSVNRFVVHDGTLFGVDGTSLMTDSFSTAPEERLETSVFAIDAATGEDKWVFHGVDESFGTGFAVSDGMVFVSSEYDIEDGDGRLREASVVYAIDAESGQEQWKFEPEGKLESNIFVAGPTVLFSSMKNLTSSDFEYKAASHTYVRDARTGEHRFELFNNVERGDIPLPPLRAVQDGRLYLMAEGDYESFVYRMAQ